MVALTVFSRKMIQSVTFKSTINSASDFLLRPSLNRYSAAQPLRCNHKFRPTESLTVKAVHRGVKAPLAPASSQWGEWLGLDPQSTAKLLTSIIWSLFVQRSSKTIPVTRKLFSYAVLPISKRACLKRQSLTVTTWWSWILKMLAHTMSVDAPMKSKAA